MYTPGEPSPDRMDALDWAFTDLMIRQAAYDQDAIRGGHTAGRRDVRKGAGVSVSVAWPQMEVPPHIDIARL